MEEILNNHIHKCIVQEGDPSLRITVRRQHLWKDVKLVLSRTNIVYSMGMRVTFISEAAVDEGGPRREFFRLVLADIASNNALFDGGSERRVVRHNLIELQGNSYLIVGRIFIDVWWTGITVLRLICSKIYDALYSICGRCARLPYSAEFVYTAVLYTSTSILVLLFESR